MALRTIRTEGDPVLTKQCRTIDKMTARLRTLAEDMLDRMQKGTFMPKQVNSDNRVIPYQLYLVELKKILESLFLLNITLSVFSGSGPPATVVEVLSSTTSSYGIAP